MSESSAGVRLRRLDSSDLAVGGDVDQVLAVMVAHELPFCEEPDVTRTTLIGQLNGPGAMPEHHRVAVRGGVYVGAVIVEVDAAKSDVFIDVYSLPTEGPQVARELIRHGLESAREIVAGRSDWTVSSGCVIGDEALARELAGARFVHRRTYWRMIRHLRGLSVEAPEAPAGIRREVARTPQQLRKLHQAYLDSFAGHYGFVERSEEDYLHRLANGDGPTSERWWLALDGDQVVGLCIQDDSRAEFNTAWIRTLGVVPEYRGRGIARWLLYEACANAAARGMQEIGLTVDSDNSTGATRLYESVGMRSQLSIALWEQPAGSS